jgi:DNA (cytosine-5)-methyltransferase 1
MRFGSVCSGIEAASVAWHPLGWKAAWLSEIEPFPSAVLAHHYPDVPNLGDMTTLPERILSGEVEAPDLFCGGTPCQAFSVAGLRNSLDDARGNLSLTFVGIANAIDHVRSVRSASSAIIFWENVPGVLSTKDNAFGCFLGALAGEDEPIIPSGEKWTNAGCVYGPQRAVAWRVLDAQYFGVAQRRRRVFVVASARDDFDPAAVLFEFDSVRRDTAPSREKGKAVASGVRTGASISSGHGYWLDAEDRAATLRAQDSITKADTLLTQPYPVANCLTARMHKGINSTVDEGQTPVIVHGTQDPAFVAQPIPLDMMNIRERASDDRRANRIGRGYGEVGDPMFTITKANHHAVAQVVGALACNTGPNGHDAGNFACNQAVDAGHVLPVAQPITFGMDGDIMGDVMETLTTREGNITDTAHAVSHPPMQVRRLTPVECERLQGFPDNYTNIPWRKKPEAPDGPRYKALGNSWAVPNVRWIGQRIADHLNPQD